MDAACPRLHPKCGKAMTWMLSPQSNPVMRPGSDVAAGKVEPMKTIQSKAELDLYQEIVRLVAEDAPNDWIIAVMKVDLGGDACEVELNHIDSTGHVIWFDTAPDLRHKLCQACGVFQRASGAAGAAYWTRAYLTLSAGGMISADFWRG